MMNDFLKRLLLSAGYVIGAMCLIHIVMGTDPGYGGHWLYIFTGKIVWLIALILKTTFFLVLATGIFYFLIVATQAHDSWQNNKTEEAMKMNRQEVEKRNAAQEAIAASARKFEAVAEKKRKEKEIEAHQRKRQLDEAPKEKQREIFSELLQFIEIHATKIKLGVYTASSVESSQSKATQGGGAASGSNVISILSGSRSQATVGSRTFKVGGEGGI